MIPAGQESQPDGGGERAAPALPLEQLLETVARMVEIAESRLPPAAQLDLLHVQIGTAQFWAEQLQYPDAAAEELRAPHFRVRRPIRSS